MALFTKTKKMSIMFADICGSTRLYDTLGDETARKIIADTLALLTESVKRFQGTVIKTIGDEIMCTFPDAESGLKAGVDMQESLEDANDEGFAEVPVSIRVGFHYGPAIMEDGDVHGDAVNVAARMASQAKADQIITTSETSKVLSPALQEDMQFVDYAPIKGKGTVEIVKFQWKEDDATQMSADIPNALATLGETSELTLQYKDAQISLNSEREIAVLGRSATCDLAVKESLASRKHITIELRRDKFFLIDQSTNGTYIQQADGSEAFVRREEVPLIGEGKISLGRAFNDNPQELVSFSYSNS
ncbi:adenylate/guanylate cyclase domain-containing protein [Marinospirillum perlucidum]|uniref:adenylate/guanylate cyclase domain-containing protein n=1 Tax=Marinospirillum perlucidum TaxID=1982602 RepID=UPI00138FE89F|nr:adenylate/guanylate cyclase domain-containing protein [Marinospirillum perlucidum]